MKYELQLHEKHLERIKTFKPINALKEMIWNSFDADALNITVEIKRNEFNLFNEPVISEIVVIDDGNGISSDSTESAFRNFGYSSKSNGNKKSPSGRRMHGSKGEGRYSLFSIGKNINWFSTYTSDNGNKTFSISFDSANHGKTINISSEKSTKESTGLKITIGFIEEEARIELEKSNMVYQELLKEFAPCLLAYPELKITFENKSLTFQDAILLQKDYFKQIDDENVSIIAVEWKEKITPEIYYCDEGKIPLEQIQLQSKHSISVYAASKKIGNEKELFANFSNKTILPDDLKAIKDFIDECIEDFERQIITRKEGAFIQTLKDEGVYPILSEPVTIVDKHNMNLFNSVVIEMSKKVTVVRSGSNKDRKVVNMLLYEALRSNPSSIKTILTKVVDLTKEDQDKFAKLLSQIELSQIIKTIESVVDRLKFLEMLYDMIYTEIGKGIKERTEFQKMLSTQLWIFGEQYTYSSHMIDRSIKNILEKYTDIFGRKEIEYGELENGELIPDICLFSDRTEGDYGYEHLVVEIKKPTKILTSTEVEQIKKYARTITSQNQFQNDGHKWTFILLGKGFDDGVKFDLTDKTNGVIARGDNFVVRVLQWEEIIRLTKRQYQYFKEKLEIDFKNHDVSDGITDHLDKIRNNN